MLNATGNAHSRVVPPEAAGSGRGSRTSPRADANQLGGWVLPAGEVCAGAPAALHWPDGPFVSPRHHTV